MNKIVLLLTILISASCLYAEDFTRDPGGGTIIIVNPNPKDNPSGKPRIPAKVPFGCYLHDGFVRIVSQHPIQPSIQIYSDVLDMFVTSFYSTNAETIHYVNIEPQGTNLTIEIEVDGKTYTGEFFYWIPSSTKSHY